MIQIEEIATQALAHNSLQVRSLLQEFLRQKNILADTPQPQVENKDILAFSAALLELLGERLSEQAPSWTANIGPARQPIFLVQAAQRMPRLRALCEESAPEPLRKRRLYAPPNYLEFA